MIPQPYKCYILENDSRAALTMETWNRLGLAQLVLIEFFQVYSNTQACSKRRATAVPNSNEIVISI